MKRDDDHPQFNFDDDDKEPDYLSKSTDPVTSKRAGRLHQSDNRRIFPADSYKGQMLTIYADGSELTRYEARDKAYQRFGRVAETFRKRVSDLLDIGYLEETGEERPYQSKNDCQVLRISERGRKYYQQMIS